MSLSPSSTASCSVPPASPLPASSPLLDINHSQGVGFGVFFSSRNPGTTLLKLISRQIVSLLQRAHGCFCFLLLPPAFFSCSASREARAWAGSSARAASSPSQPSSGFLWFLTHAPRSWYRIRRQGTKTWPSAQPCLARMGSEAAGSSGARDKGWGGLEEKCCVDLLNTSQDGGLVQKG